MVARSLYFPAMTRSDPLRRYGVGVLYSGGAPAGPADDPLMIPGVAENEGQPQQPPPELTPASWTE